MSTIGVAGVGGEAYTGYAQTNECFLAGMKVSAMRAMLAVPAVLSAPDAPLTAMRGNSLW
jgi:hypothetical protein